MTMSEELRFFSLKADTIAFDPKEAGEALTAACLRQKKYWRVTAICDNGTGDILFSLVSSDCDRESKKYYFSPFPSPSVEESTSEIRVRFQAGMTFRGSFLRSGTLWGLYERP